MGETVLTREHLERVVDRFMEYDAFAFDTETKGEYRLDPRRNIVFWMQICGPGLDSVVIPFGHPNGRRNGTTLEPRMCNDGKIRRYKVPTYAPAPDQLTPAEVFSTLKPLFFDPTKTKVAHNAKFDLESCSKYWGELPPGPYFDTQVADFLCNENHHRYGLAYSCEREFGFTWDKKIAERLEEQPFAVAERYCHFDATYTWMLYRRLAPRLKREHVEPVMSLEMDVLPALCAMEDEGIDVDIDALRALDKDLDIELGRLKTNLFRIAGTEWNFNSTPQKVQIFYGKKSSGGQGLKPTKRTKGGAPSCDADALAAHVGNPLVDAFAEYQEVSTLSSTYVKAYLGTGPKKTGSRDHNDAPPYNEQTGRIHANFKQFGTVTGRFSCVSGDTLLEISRGTFRIDEYLPRDGDLIQTHTGRWQPVLAKLDQGIRPTIALNLANGSGICCTVDHKILTPTGWQMAGYLRVGDEVCVDVDQQSVGRRRQEHQEGQGSLLAGSRQADDERDSDTSADKIRERADRSIQPRFRAGQGTESSPLLALKDGRTQPYDREVRGSAPQLQGRGTRRLRVSTAEDWGPVSLRSSSCDGGVPGHGARLSASGVGCTPHRRGSVQQQPEQLGADVGGRPRSSARSDAPPTSRVESVGYAGAQQVWDLAVATDHSFVGNGVILHNCSEPNLQNIPRPDTELGQRVRGLFIAPPDYTFIVADWSQIEYRILAQMSRDTRLIQTFVDGVDFHTYVAAMLLNKPMEDVTKVERTLSKNTNFATIYQAGLDKIAAMSGVSLSQAKSFKAAHEKMLPKVYAFARSIVKDCKREHPPHIVTMMGRKRRLPEILWPGDDNWGRRSYAERQAINARIQGSAADLMKLAIVRLDMLMPDDFNLLLTVHDELVMKVPDDRVEDGISVMTEAMMGEDIAAWLDPVPLVADIHAVKRWSDAKS